MHNLSPFSVKIYTYGIYVFGGCKVKGLKKILYFAS